MTSENAKRPKEGIPLGRLGHAVVDLPTFGEEFGKLPHLCEARGGADRREKGRVDSDGRCGLPVFLDQMLGGATQKALGRSGFGEPALHFTVLLHRA